MNEPPPSTSRTADSTAILFALVFPSIFTWVYFVGLADSPSLSQQVVYVVGKLVQFGLPVVWVFAVQRRALEWKRPAARGLIEGLVFGVIVAAAMLALYYLWLKPAGFFGGVGSAVQKKVEGFGIVGFWSYFALGSFYSLVHSGLEEYYWRWFVFGQMRRLVSLGTAIAVSSLGFMAHHVILLAVYFGWSSPAVLLFSLAVAVGGVVWAWIYERSGSLWGPWLSHLVVDVAIFLIGYDLVHQLVGP